MNSQQLQRSTSATEAVLELGEALLEDGRAGLALDYIISESMNPMVQKEQSIAWQETLLRLASVMPHLIGPRKWPGGIMDTVKKRLPAAIAAYRHPLSCLVEEGSMRFALLQILRVLAELSRSDKTLCEALYRYRIPYIAILTWLSGYDAVFRETSEQAAEAATSCSVILDVFRDFENFIPEATAKLGNLTTARKLLAAFQPRMGSQHFGQTCAQASVILGHSCAQTAHELLRNGVLIRALPIFWGILASEPTIVYDETLMPALVFAANTMANHAALGNEASTAIFIEMVQSCDLASFCTLTTYRSVMRAQIYGASFAYDEAALLWLARAIVRACKERPDLIQTHVKPCFLPALEHVRDLDPAAIGHANAVIDVWVSLTETSPPDGPQETQEVRIFETLSEVGHVGCSWYQCIFHWGEAKGAVKRAMFLDNSCKRAQYCSRYCQTRDWKDGGHRRRCITADKRR